MTEDIFTGILEAYRKEEISIRKTKRQIRLLLDEKETSTKNEMTEEEIYDLFDKYSGCWNDGPNIDYTNFEKAIKEVLSNYSDENTVGWITEDPETKKERFVRNPDFKK
jgi:hypothetical protein